MKRIVALIFLFLVIGCNTGSDVPKGILPPEKMQHVMWDMIQADGLVAYSYDTMMRRPAKRMEVYSTVLASHKLTQKAFRKNMDFYESRPDLLKIVLDSLQQMALRDTATIIVPTPKVTQDSAPVKVDTVKSRRLSIDKIKKIKLPKPI